MCGLGEVEEIFKTAPREHAAISPTVGTAKGKARKLTRHSFFKWRVDLQGKKKKVETQYYKPVSPGYQKSYCKSPLKESTPNQYPQDSYRLGLRKKNLMNKVHQTLMKMSHHTQSQQKQ